MLADVEDNSDIPERLFKTQFTRWTLSVTIDDAYLFSAPTMPIPVIESISLTSHLDSQEITASDKETENLLDDDESGEDIEDIGVEIVIEDEHEKV